MTPREEAHNIVLGLDRSKEPEETVADIIRTIEKALEARERRGLLRAAKIAMKIDKQEWDGHFCPMVAQAIRKEAKK